MDLIKQLIAVKKTNNKSEIFEKIIDEFLIYEKLSKSPKFQNIYESEVTQKRIPTIWSALNGDNTKWWIFTNVLSIVTELRASEYDVFRDLDQNLTTKQKKQQEILGKVNNLDFQYRDLSSLPSLELLENENISKFYLTEKQRIVIITIDENKVIAYHGLIPETTEVVKEQDFEVKPFVYEEKGHTISIESISTQGNNDYTIGTIDCENLSFPEANIMKVGELTYHLNQNDINEITMKMTDLPRFCQKLIEIVKEV